MKAKFEKVKRFADADFNLPIRKTTGAAGYDFEIAEDIVVPPYSLQIKKLKEKVKEKQDSMLRNYTLKEIASLTKETGAKPTLVSTGVKCKLAPGYYLELSVRSSTPLKYWIVLANSVGIIDADYYNNPDNEGEIFFQVINLSPFPIALKKGDIIGQGIIKRYFTTDDDNLKEGATRIGGFGSTSGESAAAPTARGLRANSGIIDEAMNIKIDPSIHDVEDIKEELAKELEKALYGQSLFDACM